MKNTLVKFIVFLGIIFLPFYVYADTYTEAETKVKEYLDKNEYKNSYNKYLYTDGTNKFSDMISKNEFEITRNGRSMSFSYLWNGHAFWSNTVDSGKNIPIRNGYTPLASGESTDGIRTRVTQYVKNTAVLYGSGTYSDPWLFAPQYNVRITVNDSTKGYITDSSYSSDPAVIKDETSFIYTAGSGMHRIYIQSLGENEYLGSTCGYIINGINANSEGTSDADIRGYILVTDITRDTECTINFGERPKMITLDSSYNDKTSVDPSVLYVSPERGWFSDKFGNNQITEINRAPERLGYNFRGYRNSTGKDNACSVSDNFVSPDKKLNVKGSALETLETNDVLYACYEPITYTIKYNCTQGTGTTASSQHVFNQKKALTAENCERTGYDFKSWNTKADGTGDSYNDLQEVTGIYNVDNGTLELYAMWKPKNDIKYTVNYYQQNIEGNKYELKETKVFTDGTADTQKTIVPVNYTGFTKPANQNVVIKYDGSTVINFNYVRNSYNVTFNANGHGTPSPASISIKYNDTYRFPTISEKGYTLKGWFKESSLTNEVTESTKMTTASAHTLYAKWEANKYTVKHSCGTGSGTVANIIATYDTTFTSASNSCTKRGYKQIGWTTRSNETNDGYGWSNWSGKWTYDNGEYGISNRTLQLYPLWQANTYTVTYSCGSTSTQTATYNASFSIAGNTCTKKGYTHTGWTTNSNGTNDGHNWSNWSGTWAYVNGEYGIANGKLQLYPMWQANTYTIKYSCGTGSGTVASQSILYDTTVTIAKSGCTKNGYAFSGWTTNSNETNDGHGWSNWSGTWAYDNGQYGISNRTLQLYPMWTQCTAGNYSNNGVCTKCANGTYSGAGASSCTTCPVGSYCYDGNKYTCPSGYTSNSGATAQSSCYMNVSAGKYVKTAGDSSATNCSAGYKSSSHTVYYGKTSTCTKCEAGTYNTSAGSTSCSDCPAGKYCIGGTSIENCPAGKYRSSTKGKSASDCSSCAAGSMSSAGAISCTTCPAGKYNTTAGSSSCSDCPAGKYCTGGTNQTNCPAGKYRSSTGGKSVSDCTNCSAGQMSSAGATSCSNCPAGKYNTTAGSSSCSDCPAGKYCTGGTNNTNCPAGTYRSSTGGKSVSDCTNCAAGQKSSAGATSCSNCPAGQYNTTAGSSTCSDCPAGKYNTTAGSTSCSDCPKGKYCTGGTNQTNCPVNTYRNAVGGKTVSDCTACPAGQTSSAGARSCASCAAGTYLPSGGTSCVACPKGKYCTGGTNQTNCPAGTYRSSTGGKSASDCTKCDAGSISSEGATSCTTCAAGTYNTIAGSSSCDSCPKGKYCTGGSNNTNCPAGTYRSSTGGKVLSDCSNCSAGQKSSAGATSCSNCAAGTYNTTAGSSSCGSCPKGKYCTGGSNNTNCPAGTYRASTGGKALSDCTNCSAGTYNPNAGGTASSACSNCPTGEHSSAGASSCTKNTYYVAYNKNGGSGSMSNSTHTYGTAKNLTANAFTRSGYKFTKWNTKADGSGTAYSDKASVKNLTSSNGGTVTLYAQWSLTVSCDNAAITYYNQNEQRSPIPCNVYNGVYSCVANTSTGKCDCTINAFSGSSYYCCTFDNTYIKASWNADAGKYQCKVSFKPVQKSGSCKVVNNSYSWCDKYW